MDPSGATGHGEGTVARGRVVVVDAVQAIAPAGAKAWHVDRVHPSPAGHRRLALGVATALADLDPAYAVAPAKPPPSGRPPPSCRPPNSAVGQAPSTARARTLAARLPAAPDPPSAWQRLVWLLAGRAAVVRTPGTGLSARPAPLRRARPAVGAGVQPGSMVTSLADSGLDPRRRIGRG